MRKMVRKLETKLTLQIHHGGRQPAVTSIAVQDVSPRFLSSPANLSGRLQQETGMSKSGKERKGSYVQC
jgi:hypothetical protein